MRRRHRGRPGRSMQMNTKKRQHGPERAACSPWAMPSAQQSHSFSQAVFRPFGCRLTPQSLQNARLRKNTALLTNVDEQTLKSWRKRSASAPPVHQPSHLPQGRSSQHDPDRPPHCSAASPGASMSLLAPARRLTQAPRSPGFAQTRSTQHHRRADAKLPEYIGAEVGDVAIAAVSGDSRDAVAPVNRLQPPHRRRQSLVPDELHGASDKPLPEQGLKVPC